MFKVIAVCFKKVKKAQNPCNSFQTRKCIGKTAHLIPNQTKLILFTVYFTESEEKEILRIVWSSVIKVIHSMNKQVSNTCSLLEQRTKTVCQTTPIHGPESNRKLVG